jgi:rhamnulokinase
MSTTPSVFLSIDLGAESGRAVLGKLDSGIIELKEIHRFSNAPVRLGTAFYWDFLHVFAEIRHALTLASKVEALPLKSIAVDTWGVDFGLLDSEKNLLSMPRSYRDPFTRDMVGLFHEKHLFAEALYRETGIQTMPINSLFQWMALKQFAPSTLKAARYLLFMPDLVNFFLTGVIQTEPCIASTSQLMDPFTRDWNDRILGEVGLPRTVLPPLKRTGTIVGTLLQTLSEETGLGAVQVLSVASHDTASAIAAIPATHTNWAFLSSGTWSLMGIETSEPIVNEASSTLNFTNEAGVDGTVRFLKNMCGLWLLQQCKKCWEKEGALYSYEQMVHMAEKARPFQSWIQPDDPSFSNPSNMPEAIRNFCRETGQKVPETHAAIIRCIFDSLALSYRLVMNQLKSLSPHPIETLYVLGGGAQNALLCQLTADAVGLPVFTGPNEATAVGNILMQARTLGECGSLKELRSIVCNSFQPGTFYPSATDDWERLESEACSVFSGRIACC